MDTLTPYDHPSRHCGTPWVSRLAIAARETLEQSGAEAADLQADGPSKLSADRLVPRGGPQSISPHADSHGRQEHPGFPPR
jgi:hypothetical protein